MVIVTYFFTGNLLSPHSGKHQGILYMHFPADRTAHTTTIDGPVVDQWLERKIARTVNASSCVGSFGKPKSTQVDALPPELRPAPSHLPEIRVEEHHGLN